MRWLLIIYEIDVILDVYLQVPNVPEVQDERIGPAELIVKEIVNSDGMNVVRITKN